MFNSFKRTALFVLLCSIAVVPGVTLPADQQVNKAQDCAHAKNIVQRICRTVNGFITSGDPKLIVSAHAYLVNLKPSGRIAKLLVKKMITSITKLLTKLRTSSRNSIFKIKSIIVPAFEDFGNDIENLAGEIKGIDNATEIQELSRSIGKMQTTITQRMLNLGLVKKGALATKIAQKVFRKRF